MTDADSVDIAPPAALDRFALVGEIPGRQVDDLALKIGSHAVIRAFTVVYAGSRIGSHLQTGHGAVIREQNIIGDHLSIWNNSTIDYGSVLGDHVRIHCNVYVAQFSEIGDDVFLAPGVMLANDPHPICYAHLKGPTIGRGARIGMNATVLPRVRIGEDALIGAGAVVTKDVPARSIVVGNPARVIGSVDDIECRERIVQTSGVENAPKI